VIIIKNCEEKKKSKSKKNTNLEGYKKHSIILYKKYNCILKNHVFNIFYSYLFSWDLIKKKTIKCIMGWIYRGYASEARFPVYLKKSLCIQLSQYA